MHSPSTCMLTALTCSKKTHLWEIKSSASLRLLKPTGLGHISASFFIGVHRMMNTDWWHLQLNYRLQGKAWKDETPPAQSGCVSSSRHIHVKPACSVTPRSEALRVKERALGNSSRVLEPKKKRKLEDKAPILSPSLLQLSRYYPTPWPALWYGDETNGLLTLPGNITATARLSLLQATEEITI